MKECTRCNTSKPLEDFYKQVKQGWQYYDSMCKSCRSAYTSDRRRETKISIVEYLGGKCTDCGLIDDPCVYDCHHLDPNKKDFSPSKQNKKFDSIKNELDKCVLLCANCHRKRHWA